MSIKTGERIIKIVNISNAWKHGGWYEGLIGKEFSASMYSIMEAEYTVQHDGGFKRLPADAVIIVKDTE